MLVGGCSPDFGVAMRMPQFAFVSEANNFKEKLSNADKVGGRSVLSSIIRNWIFGKSYKFLNGFSVSLWL